MSIPRRAVAYLFLLILLVSPALALLNTSVNPRVYFSEETAIPFELWVVIIIFGAILLVLSFVQSRAISILSALAMSCFMAAAFAAPMVGYFSYDIIEITSGGITTQSILPVVSLVNQPWVAWFLWGFALLAFINIWRGVIMGWMAVTEQRQREEDYLDGL